jgi:elongation factor P--beta-lysine ligase
MPEGAVVSFGIGYEEADEADVANAERMLDEESTIPTTCSVTNAFPDSDTYAQWASDVPEAAVMELGIDEIVAIGATSTGINTIIP